VYLIKKRTEGYESGFFSTMGAEIASRSWEHALSLNRLLVLLNLQGMSWKTN